MKKYIVITIFLFAVFELLIVKGHSVKEPTFELVIHGIAMVSIPGGSFQMGHNYVYDPAIPDNVNKYYRDEQPVHKVTLSAFRMSATEITQEQYKKVAGQNPSTFTGDTNLPVTNVSADAAFEFCNMLSEAAGFEPCYDPKTKRCDFSKNGFRLPTEAEWEYACRAGTTTTLFNTGNTESNLNRSGWYIRNSGGKTHPVACKEPNTWGFYDMHGNVWEFCYDGFLQDTSYGPYPAETVTDPIGIEYHDMRVMRGGGWFSEPSDCRSSVKSCFWTGGGNYYIGFRVVRRP